MKERPILMSAPMVRAILAGRKTQIRRPLKQQPPARKGIWSYVACSTEPKWRDTFCYAWPDANGKTYSIRGRESCLHFSPPCLPGDRLWVRETWAWYGCEYLRDEVVYRADGVDLPAEFEHWRPSIHMPRWSSRITLEITGVRVERLNEISEADAIAEGLKTLSKDGGQTYKHGIPDVDGLPCGAGWKWADWEVCPRAAFKKLWESTCGPNSFDDKWVWAIEFRRVEP